MPDCISFYVPDHVKELIEMDHWEPAAYFMDLIARRSARGKGNEHGFVQLQAARLRETMGRSIWPLVRDELCSKKIVETDGIVVRDLKCMGYRFLDPCSKLKRTSIPSASRLAKKMIRFKTDAESALLPVHLHAKSILRGTEFNHAAAMTEAEGFDFGPIPEQAERARWNLESACQMIRDKEHVYVCDKFGRCHTLFTSLDKRLRKYMTWKGRPLIGLDMANGQPLLLGSVASIMLNSNKMARSRLRNTKWIKGDSKIYHYFDNVVASNRNEWPSDLTRYVELGERGKLYEN